MHGILFQDDMPSLGTDTRNKRPRHGDMSGPFSLQGWRSYSSSFQSLFRALARRLATSLPMGRLPCSISEI